MPSAIAQYYPKILCLISWSVEYILHYIYIRIHPHVWFLQRSLVVRMIDLFETFRVNGLYYNAKYISEPLGRVSNIAGENVNADREYPTDEKDRGPRPPVRKPTTSDWLMNVM